MIETATKVKQRPIIFSGEMVRAILAGRKTQTRRVMKPQPVLTGGAWTWKSFAWTDEGRIPLGNFDSPLDACPYGQPGERLWLTQGASFYKAVPFKERFWSRVYKFEACWEWFGKTNRKRYGMISKDGKAIASQRASWVIHYGDIPKGRHVLHTCDMAWCVNPSHLYLGDNSDNVRDKVNRGRTARVGGEDNGHSVLRQEQIDEIRSLYWERNMRQKEISEQYGITQPQVSKIVNGKRWLAGHGPIPISGHRWLEVVNVRVERVQEISYEDSIAEGAADFASFCEHNEPGELNRTGETAEQTSRRLKWPQRNFSELWDSINAKKHPWSSNPWVWAIEFKRLETT